MRRALLVPVARHQHAPRQDAERALHDAHVLVDDGVLDAGLVQERVGKGDEHGVVAAQKLDHRRQPSRFRAVPAKPVRRIALAIVPSCRFVAARPAPYASGEQGVYPWASCCLSRNRQAERASISPLVEVTAAGMERVNRLVIERTSSDVALIPEVARYLIDSGGKRLRPMVTIASAGACGYRGDADVKLAASVEFMHTATLFHDDVVDESDTRRGKRTARLVWGNQESVLVGDFLLGQAFKMMVEVGSLEALDVLSAAAVDHRRGRGDAAHHRQEHRDDRGRISRRRSAPRRRCCSRPRRRSAPSSPAPSASVRAAFRSYGANLGIAFQLIDDALDYGGQTPTLGKDVGDDFREGKVTLPVVLAYRRGTRRRPRVLEAHAGRRARSATTTSPRPSSLLDRTRALKDTVERARHYGAMAHDALAPLPDEPFKAALLQAVAFCIARAH